MFLFRSSGCTKLVPWTLLRSKRSARSNTATSAASTRSSGTNWRTCSRSDATVDYGTRVYGQPLKITGRDEIIAFFRAKLGPDIITVHAAGQPEITVHGDTATGSWRFEDTVIATEHRIVITGAAFYQDRYERGEDGTWRIAHTGYVRTYEAMMSLDDLPSFRLTAGPAGAAPTDTGASVADAAAR